VTLKGPNVIKILMALARPSVIISTALMVMHLKQYYERIQNYAALQNKALSGELPIWNILEHWASVFTAVTIIINRKTPLH